MTSVRSQLVDDLKAALPAMRIIGAADPPDRVVKPTILIYQSNIERIDQFGLDRIRVDVTAWLLTGAESTEKAEAKLEDSLSDLLAALQPLGWIDWTACERLTFGEDPGPQFHGYKLTLSALGQIGQ